MSQDCRHDKVSRKTRKDHVCEWCSLIITKGSPMVRVSGISDDQPYMGKFHPECWRAEHFWWKRPDNARHLSPQEQAANPGYIPDYWEMPESWPEERMARGRSDSEFLLAPQFTSRHIIQHELDYRYRYAKSWLVEDQDKLCPKCFGVSVEPTEPKCQGCFECDFGGTKECFDAMQLLMNEAQEEGYKLELAHAEYVKKGVCSGCGATCPKEASTMCRPQQMGESGDVTCAGKDLWLDHPDNY